ncbi:hypothetical protein AMECASPLE_015663 [Ameca splendens]|uniref:Uncharacterized protein n=1 Tax=Ameca splendens TaxID=208324 RepID=A0ABV1A8C8_9TELE
MFSLETPSVQPSASSPSSAPLALLSSSSPSLLSTPSVKPSPTSLQPHNPVPEFSDKGVQVGSRFPHHSPTFLRGFLHPVDQTPEPLCGSLGPVDRLPELLFGLQHAVNKFAELHPRLSTTSSWPQRRFSEGSRRPPSPVASGLQNFVPPCSDLLV